MLEAAIIILCMIESGNNPNAIGDRHMANRSYGVLQIRQCVLDDVNRHYRERYTRADCMDVEKSHAIARHYLLMYCGPDATLETYIRTWNGGPNGRHKRGTLAHWRKAQRIVEAL